MFLVVLVFGSLLSCFVSLSSLFINAKFLDALCFVVFLVGLLFCLFESEMSCLSLLLFFVLFGFCLSLFCSSFCIVLVLNLLPFA